MSKLIALLKHFLIDGRGLDEVSLEDKSRSFKSITKGSLSILSVKDISKLIRELSVAQKDVLPLCEGECCLTCVTNQHLVYLKEHQLGDVRHILACKDMDMSILRLILKFD